MFWKEVQQHLRNGARLVCTTVVPGGSSVALRYPPRIPAGRATLIHVRRASSLPSWAGASEPERSDPRTLKAALERLMAAEEERQLLEGFVNLQPLDMTANAT